MPLFGTNIEDQLMKLKMTVKQLQRLSKKAEKDEKTSRNKLKKAIEQDNIEGARIYAQDAIRHKHEALNYLRLSSRVDGVASKVEGAVRMGQVSKTMRGVVAGMEKVLDQMDVEKLSKTMEDFERQFEDVDVRTAYMEGAMSNSTTLSTPEEQVEGLMQEVADDHGLQLATKLNQAVAATPKEKIDDQLNDRLRALRSQS